jgi:S1-C subfamily serine protease
MLALLLPAAPALAQTSGTPAATSSSEPLSAVEVVKRVAPAVVTVVNEQRQSDVFGQSSGQAVPAGEGTGFIIDSDGHIVTNWHVVTGGDAFQVIFSDGTAKSAKLVGSDAVSDLAVVKVSGRVPATVEFGDSSALQPGQPVLAIGSALGALTNTVTEGIVSALGRSNLFQNTGCTVYTNLIQHDAAINPGNSGGPLLNLQGQVVGVNTLGIPIVPGENIPAQGLFFAIPSNTVKQITGKLISDGEITYPYLGVSTTQVTPAIASEAGLSVDHGEVVLRVVAGDPADQAGLQEKDVILALGDQQINAQHSLIEALFQHNPGEKVTLTVQRGKKEMKVDVTLGKRPDSLTAACNSQQAP